MKLSAPKTLTAIIALILVVFAVIAYFAIPAVAPYALWITVAGFVLLLLGNLIKGL